MPLPCCHSGKSYTSFSPGRSAQALPLLTRSPIPHVHNDPTYGSAAFQLVVAMTLAKSVKHPHYLFCGARITLLAMSLHIDLSDLTGIFDSDGTFSSTRDTISLRVVHLEADGP
ncbi:unnamed protein product [Linum trigynum]|uniref:Uncharacterized protein n=1 Tax=Linum trigynum TaxID=586398 RepID=A0AAV2GMX4_9ROSI